MPNPYKFLTPIDFNNEEITQFRIEVLANNPISALIGRVLVNSTTKKLVFHDGDGFVDPTDRAAHYGTQLASTISDFSARVLEKRLDQFAVPAANVSFAGYRITGLANAVDPTDAVNLSQLRSLIHIGPTPPLNPDVNQLWIQTP